MSKVALSGNVLGTGTITLAAPNTNSTVTLNLPAATGTVDTLQRAGNVLQVVQFTLTAQFTTTVKSMVGTTLQVSITPTRASSKILVLAQGNGRAIAPAGNNCFYDVDLRRNGTMVWYGFAQGGNFGSTDIRVPISIMHLDSPASTSSITYQVFMSSTYASQVYMNGDSGTSTITVMEIAA